MRIHAGNSFASQDQSGAAFWPAAVWQIAGFAKPRLCCEKLGCGKRLWKVRSGSASATLQFRTVYRMNDRSESLKALFRVTGKEAELWHADTGAIEPASFQISGETTTVPLELEPWGAVFVVFRKATSNKSRDLPKSVESSVATMEGPWQVSFQPNRGAAEVTFEKLTPWNESTDQGVKYFSGTGTYTKTIQAPQDWFRGGARLWLDLGDVRNLAEVSVNGKPAGIAWKVPYRVDVTGLLKPGDNNLRISVINTWVNRMIGDRQANATTKYTFTNPVFYKADSPLLPSGLLGPVRVLQSSKGDAAKP